MKKILSRIAGYKVNKPIIPAPEKRPPIPNSPKSVMFFDQQIPILKPTEYEGSNNPILSFIVIVYKMPEQAKKTLLSLTPSYQQGASANDYEVIVVENSSDQNIEEKDVTSFGSNFSYHRRNEKTSTPVYAVNYGAKQAKGDNIVLVIDGARMLSPGVVNYMIAATRLAEHPIISVPGYHLGSKLQQRSIQEGFDSKTEEKLLESIKWPNDGYRLFEISCLSGTSGGGFFRPIGESNCLCIPVDIWKKIGGIDENFILIGGGQSNLDLYKRVVELSETTLITLVGEGTFHQVHGGVTTGQAKEDMRREIHKQHFAEYTALRGQPYSPPEKRSVFLGSFPDSAMKNVFHSSEVMLKSQATLPPKN
jgi:hypothetical protein